MSHTEQTGLATAVLGGLHRRGRAWPGLRMTPMIDVIFLLLTFFVLTAQFERPEQALPLVFGASAARSDQTPTPLELAILPEAAGCAVTLGDAEPILISHEQPATGLAVLAEQVRQTVLADEGRPAPIRLNCDDAVSWELVTKVYDVLYGLGARDITFVVKE